MTDNINITINGVDIYEYRQLVYRLMDDGKIEKAERLLASVEDAVREEMHDIVEMRKNLSWELRHEEEVLEQLTFEMEEA